MPRDATIAGVAGPFCEKMLSGDRESALDHLDAFFLAEWADVLRESLYRKLCRDIRGLVVAVFDELNGEQIQKPQPSPFESGDYDYALNHRSDGGAVRAAGIPASFDEN